MAVKELALSLVKRRVRQVMRRKSGGAAAERGAAGVARSEGGPCGGRGVRPREKGRTAEAMRPSGGDAAQAATRCTGMPSATALSTRLSVMPEPGNAMTPFGRRFSSSSLRRNGAARPCAFQSGLHTT